MPHFVECTLSYNPQYEGGGQPIPLASTTNVRALRAVRQAILEEAEKKFRALDSVDPGVGEVAKAERDKLRRIMAQFLPEEDDADAGVYGSAGLRVVSDDA